MIYVVWKVFEGVSDCPSCLRTTFGECRSVKDIRLSFKNSWHSCAWNVNDGKEVKDRKVSMASNHREIEKRRMSENTRDVVAKHMCFVHAEVLWG